MNLSPYQSAALAALYILSIVGVMQFVMELGRGKDDVLLIPVMMLALLTLSVAVMGYLFGYGPLTRYLDGKKEEAASYLLKTIGSFALITAVFVLAYTWVMVYV